MKKKSEPKEGTKADLKEDMGEKKHHAPMHPKKGCAKGKKKPDPFL